MNLEAVAVVHIKEDGDTDYLICGDDKFRLFIVDERAPNDRVYEITLRDAPETIREIIGDSPIGHRNDERHAAIEARIKEELDGTPRLKVVEGKRVLAEAEGSGMTEQAKKRGVPVMVISEDTRTEMGD